MELSDKEKFIQYDLHSIMTETQIKFAFYDLLPACFKIVCTYNCVHYFSKDDQFLHYNRGIFSNYLVVFKKTVVTGW